MSKFVERLNLHPGVEEKSKNYLPLILGIAAALIITGLILLFVLKPFSAGVLSGSGDVRLCSIREQLAVCKNLDKVENKFWLDDKSDNVTSAKLYDESGKELADFSRNESDGIELFAVVQIPVNEVKKLNYYAQYKTEDGNNKKTNTVSVEITDSVPDGYAESGLNTGKDIAAVMGEESFDKLSEEEKAKKLTEVLADCSNNDPSKGESYVVKDSIKYNEGTQSVSYVNALGAMCYIDFSEKEPGVNAADGTVVSDFSKSGDIKFNGKYKNNVKGNMLLLSAIFSQKANNEQFYGELINSIKSDTSLKLTHAPATLDNIKTMLKDNYDFVAIEMHGGLQELMGVTVPMIATFGSVNEMAITQDIIEDYYANRIVVTTTQEQDTGQIVDKILLTPLFFDYYFKGGELDGKIIHLGSCLGFGNNVRNQNHYLSDSLLAGGAQAVMGHINSVFTYYDMVMIGEELDNMFDGYSFGEALDKAQNDYGANDNEFMLKYGDSNSKKAAATHTAAYNDIHGDFDAKTFDFDQVPKIEPATQKPTSKPKQPAAVDLDSFKKVSGANQVIYADSTGKYFTLVNWSSGNPKVEFSTNNVYFGKEGVTKNPREGLPATPAGTFPLGFAFSTSSLDTNLDTVRIKPNMVWIDDPNSDYYNMLIEVNNYTGIPPAKNPGKWNSSEQTYSIFSPTTRSACILIEHNGDGYTKGTPNKGSCMYISGKYSNLSSSSGDINISAEDMEKLLALLDKDNNPHIVIS